MIGKILGPSPLNYCIRKITEIRVGEDQCLAEEPTSFETYIQNNGEKPRRMNNSELLDLYRSDSKKLTRAEKLVKSILDDCTRSLTISDEIFKRLQTMYDLRRK